MSIIASRRRRFFGLIIDCLVLDGIFAVVAFGLLVFYKQELATLIRDVDAHMIQHYPSLFGNDEPAFPDAASIRPIFYMIPPVFILYYVFTIIIYNLRDAIRGVSPGKYLLGMAVRDYTNRIQTPSILRLFVRNVFLLFFPIEILVMLFNREKRRVGDMVTKSVVVRVGATKKLLLVIVVILTLGCSFVVQPMLAEGVFMQPEMTEAMDGMAASVNDSFKKSDIYKTCAAFLKVNQSVKVRVGEIKELTFLGMEKTTSNKEGLRAQVRMMVEGSRDSAMANITLTQETNGGWVVKEFTLH